MTKTTHLAAGLTFAALCSCNAPATILVCVGSLLPDIDKANSTLGRKFKFVSLLFKHRTFTHSLLFALITALINPYLCIGVLSHIFMDMFNPMGVQLLFPFGRNLKFPLINKIFVTSTKAEDVMRYILYAIITILVIYSLLVTKTSWQNELVTCWDNVKSNINGIISYVKNIISPIETDW